MSEQDQLLAPLAPAPRKMLIKGATIISMDGSVGNVPKGDILMADGVIAAIGQHLQADGAEVIDAAQMIAIPGMVDTHRHAWEGQLRRINPNAATLEDYCNATHFSFAKYYRPRDIYVGNLLTALGAIDAGITTVIDNSHNSRTAAHADAAVEALLDAGIRAVHASGAPVSGEWDKAHWPGNLARLQAKYFTNPDSLVTLAMMAQLEPEQWAVARQLGIPIVTEFFGAGMADELEGLHRQGLLGSDNIFNHCTCLPEAGWRILRETGVRVNVCPRSDAHYGIEDGMNAWQAAHQHGIRPGLSVDNETSYSGDMFMEMRVAFYLQRVMGHRQGHRHAAAPTDAFRLLEAATIDGAAVAGLEQRIGSLAPGKQADLVLIRTGDLNVYPVNNAIGTVVHAAERSNIDTVIIGGRVRKRGGVVLGVDQAKLRAAIDESCGHLFSAADYQPDLFAQSFATIHQA
ncbi:amidohydrolase family protein [Janthinobacterium sp. NKUCC08_JDC]|uniref:amidohydrolase family protein n=1 Tax=Janthinobacterium sp. NKUCC08_JDC TaxID=2842122 RepID=UPI001C5A8FCA|nr:amidohydrolase family protein [Janthinobacterium sp. NKUCC08_JDC]MBW3500234.1 amidohydrolase family protein [Janthinobacterium sp. NKUCC08_JDC]